jgi:hypothetical protein
MVFRKDVAADDGHIVISDFAVFRAILGLHASEFHDSSSWTLGAGA